MLHYSVMTTLQFSSLKLVDQHLIPIMVLLSSMDLTETLTWVSVPFHHRTSVFI